MARGLRSLGINWNFAPVLDVNNNPANPVIAERSFSADPAEVARLGRAWMQGALREGVACCVKHFPGHGDTHVDSHHDLPAVDKSLAELQALELQPFHALRREAPAVMTAHIVYPQIDPQHPATLSAQLIGRLLRDDWGYDGVVITDSLVMKAIHDRYGHERAAVLALQAGADMVMALGSREDQLAALKSIEKALAGGAITPQQAERSCARLDALAARYPVAPRPYEPAQREDDDALMRRAWAQGLAAVGGAQPPSPRQALRVITQRAVPMDGVSEAGLDAEQVKALFAGFADVEFVLAERLDAFDWAQLPADGRLNIVASNHRKRYGDSARGWRPALHLALWNPFQVLDVAAPAIVTWGYSDGALAALRAWLEGRGRAAGRPPVALKAGG